MNISLQVARYNTEVRLKELVAEIALEQGVDVDDRPHSSRPGGDALKLRGVPVQVERGMGGAILGSRPDRWLPHNERGT